MHTTTDRTDLYSAAALALAGWFAALTLLTYAAEPSKEVIAWVPQSLLGAALSTAPVSLMDGQSGGFIRLRGEAPGFVGALYANGARIVLPVASGGCRARAAQILKVTAMKAKDAT
jgi:hypothetical protein